MALVAKRRLLGVVVLFLFLITGCGESPPSSSVASASLRLTGDMDARAVTMTKIRTHCNSCHGVGPLRFIYSSNDEEVWSYIKDTIVPNSDKRWVEAIIDVLSWPTDAAPRFDVWRLPSENKDWMPKGVKRLQLAEDMTDGISTRRIMLQVLQDTRRNVGE